jgi:hypothetical protein
MISREHFISSGVDARGRPLKLTLASHLTLGANRPLYPKWLDLLRGSLAEIIPQSRPSSCVLHQLNNYK